MWQRFLAWWRSVNERPMVHIQWYDGEGAWEFLPDAPPGYPIYATAVARRAGPCRSTWRIDKDTIRLSERAVRD